MVTCQNCGSEVDEGAKFCKNCGSKMVIEEENANGNATRFCTSCGFEMPKDTKFCPECGNSTSDVPQAVNGTGNSVANSNKSPELAAILSFLIIGVGQIYLGLTKRGIILFLAAIISGILMLIVIGWITWFIVWIYAIYDAYNCGKKLNNGIVLEDSLNMDNLF